MASTVGPRYVTGTIRATAAPLAVRKVGFVPKKVRVFNKTSLAMMIWNQEMKADGSEWKKQTAAGATTLESSDGITALAGTSTEPPGFQIGAAADINDTATEDLIYEAWG